MVLHFAIGDAYICERITGTEKLSQRDPYAEFGTARFKIVRRDAPDTSSAAAARVDTTQGERLVYEAINASPTGLTGKEIAHQLGRAFNAISGRLTGLRDKGIIEDSGRRRDGARVMRVVR